jgi:cytochrome P450
MARLAAECARRRGWERGLHEWVRARSARGEPVDLSIRLPGLTVLLVNGRRLSQAVLGPPPRTDRLAAGRARRYAMGFLAPRALTVSDDEAWQRRRDWNERVLATGRPHDERAAYLAAIHEAFAAPVASVEAVREAMGRVMLAVVFGGGDPPPDLPARVRTLMEVASSPRRRALAGRTHAGHRALLYEDIRRQWDRVGERSLLGRLRSLGVAPSDEALEQVPHWMFTFVLSGTALLTRSLAMIGSRPEAFRRVREEVAAAGPLDDPETIGRLAYVEACIREAGRLFGPVTMTSHVAPRGADLDGRRVPPGGAVVHRLPLLQRDTGLDPTADDFVPERWLDPAAGARERYPYLFLGGARECPGRDLITFVCAGAIAILVGRHGVRLEAPALAADPLPLAFPAGVRVRGAPTAHADLLAMGRAELDALYRGAGGPGAIPEGAVEGTALPLPGTPLAGPLRRAARPFWRGKVFDPERGTLANRLSPLGVRAVRATVAVGDSRLDPGGQATVLDYSRSAIVARRVRDEIREVAPGLWLGAAYVGRWRVIDFALRAP